MPTSSHLSNCLTLVPAPSSLSAAQRNSHGSATMAPGFGSGDLGMVGRSAAMQRLRLQIRRIGPHFRAVLLSGEPGTGKELVARELHGMSRGAAGPFVICDAATLECSAGEGGADTSSPDRIGWLMHVAREGTLFLDGIDRMPADAQARLVRVLRRYEWAQEGAAEPQGIGTRIIASTDQDLRVLVGAGRFRVELYQKIAMVGISVAPLRDRMEDVDELSMHFLRRFAAAYGKSVDVISDAVMESFHAHNWSGNVRELENMLQCGVLQSEGAMLEIDDLPQFEKSAGDAALNTGGTERLQEVIERHVLHVLKSCDGNKLRAAEMLGISRSTLYRMLDGCSVESAG